MGLVRTVTPQAMDSDGNTKAAVQTERVERRKQESVLLLVMFGMASQSMLFVRSFVPNWPQAKGPQKCFTRGLKHVHETRQGDHVYQGNVDNHGIVEIALLVMVGHMGRNILERRV